MSDIRVNGSGGLIPPNPIEPGGGAETFNAMATVHGLMPPKAGIDEANHIAPASKMAIDRALLSRLQGG